MKKLIYSILFFIPTILSAQNNPDYKSDVIGKSNSGTIAERISNTGTGNAGLSIFAKDKVSWIVTKPDGNTYFTNSGGTYNFASTTGGLLIPRLTTAQRTGISSPADGLLVYDTDLSKFYFSDLGVWTAVATGATGVTLDGAYDFGGAGAGRTITADNGAVQIIGTNQSKLFEVKDTVTSVSSSWLQVYGSTGSIRTGVYQDLSGFGFTDGTVYPYQDLPIASFVGGVNSRVTNTSDTQKNSNFVTGFENAIEFSFGSSILGGLGNIADTTTSVGLLAGSSNRIAQSLYSGSVGGLENTLTISDYSTMVGGNTNTLANSNNSAIIGGEAHSLDFSNNSAIIGGFTSRLDSSDYSLMISASSYISNTNGVAEFSAYTDSVYNNSQADDQSIRYVTIQAGGNNFITGNTISADNTLTSIQLGSGNRINNNTISATANTLAPGIQFHRLFDNNEINENSLTGEDAFIWDVHALENCQVDSNTLSGARAYLDLLALSNFDVVNDNTLSGDDSFIRDVHGFGNSNLRNNTLGANATMRRIMMRNANISSNTLGSSDVFSDIFMSNGDIVSGSNQSAQNVFLWNSDLDLSTISGDVDGFFSVGGKVIFTTTESPASSAACTAGQITWDADYIYVCTASGAWKRAALTGGY